MTAFNISDVPRGDAEDASELGLGQSEGFSERNDAVVPFVLSHDQSSHNARLEARPYPRRNVSDGKKGKAQTARMGKKASKESVNHLRAWREFRGMTQEELAEKVDTAGNVIGLLESGGRGLSNKWLNKLAPALGTRPGFLLDFDPNDVDRELIELVLEIDQKRRPQAVEILKTFRTGTDD